MSALIRTADVSGRERYRLLTSLVVPRPIGWVSTRDADGTPNLAPFSYFAALSASPMLVGVSVGSRRGAPKDTLVNARARRAFCLNLVTEPLLEAMNASSAELPPGADEFRRAGLEPADAALVDAPCVASSPAVLECRLFKEVELEGSSNTLLIGEVLAVRLADGVPMVGDTGFVDSTALRPVGRLWGDRYAVVREDLALPRPAASEL